MNRLRDISQWKEYIESCLDFRSEEGVYRITRDMFTESELFDLEMELIFEKNWIYACHESEILKKHDFFTIQALIITLDGEGKLNALINTCQHRGRDLAPHSGTADREIITSLGCVALNR